MKRQIVLTFLISTIISITLETATAIRPENKNTILDIGGVSLTLNTTKQSIYILVNSTKHETPLKLWVTYKLLLNNENELPVSANGSKPTRNSNACFEKDDHFACRDEYCLEETKVFNYTGDIRLVSLVPNQDYLVRWMLIEGRREVEHSSWCDVLRTPEAKPLEAPKANPDSFSVVGEQRVLFWRKPTLLLMGGSKPRYKLHCFSTLDNSSMVDVELPINTTTYTIESLVGDVDLECRIWSANAVGESDDYSGIMIPARKNLVPLKSNFAVQQVLMSSGKYELRWDLVAAGRAGEDASGFYTLYWCLDVFEEDYMRSGWMRDCRSLGSSRVGLVNSFVTDAIPIKFYNRANFGVSFTRMISNESTGIVWNNCPELVDAESNPPRLRLQDIVESNQSRTVEVAWTWGNCNGLSLFAEHYSLRYCEIQGMSIVDGYKSSISTRNMRNCIDESFRSSSLYHYFGEHLVPGIWYYIILQYKSKYHKTEDIKTFLYNGTYEANVVTHSGFNWFILVLITITCFFAGFLLIAYLSLHSTKTGQKNIHSSEMMSFQLIPSKIASGGEMMNLHLTKSFISFPQPNNSNNHIL